MAPDGCPPATEPVIVSDLLITGVRAEVTPNIVRVVAWADSLSPDGQCEERRIVTRISMATETARELLKQIKGGMMTVFNEH